ncbi:MAG: CsbD family protein [Acidobacteria bacterium]|nr:CsbD family protein [Acidobacteriota bacterium]MCA1639978.1 CsbD family protein [Acidobacteriota bacterium]
MSTWNKDEVDGKFEQAKGTVKDKAGEVLGDRDLEAEGEAQNAAGETQETWGKVKRGVGDTVDAVGDAISNAGDKINKG